MKPKKMIYINPEKVIRDIRKQMSLTEMAVRLLPYMETRENAYHSFKYWLKVGRMPREKYEEMMEILHENQRKGTKHRNH